MGLSINKRKTQLIKYLFYIIGGLFLLTSCKANKTIVNDTAPSSMTTTIETSSIDSTSVLDKLTFNLPSSIAVHKNDLAQRTFKKETTVVGGFFLLDCTNDILDDILYLHEALTPLVLNTMKDVLSQEWEWYTSSSSVYGLMEYSMGNDQVEYIAYVVRGYNACYLFWFDRTQITINDEIAIMDSLYSDDVTDELNIISTQAYADAVAESMAKEEYLFEVILPSGIEKEKQTEDGALFYQKGELVGGYKIIHFEKGILPAVHENQALILDRLKEYLLDQIDLTNYDGEIIDEGLITAQFSNGINEYTHYILSYGQVGTQYDIWLDITKLDQNIVSKIISGAQLRQV